MEKKCEQKKEEENKKILNESLIALYKEQWTAIRHFDSLDWRIITLTAPIIGLLSGIIVFFPEPPSQIILLITILSICISIYGLWVVLRNRLTIELKIEIISNVEKRLNLASYFVEVLPKTQL